MKANIPFLSIWYIQPISLPWGVWWNSLLEHSNKVASAGGDPSGFYSHLAVKKSDGGFGLGKIPDWWQLREDEVPSNFAIVDACCGTRFLDLLRADYASLKKNEVSRLLELDASSCDFCLVVNRHGVPQLIFHLVFCAADEIQCANALENVAAASPECFRHGLLNELVYPLCETMKWAATARRIAHEQFIELQERVFGPLPQSKKIQFADCFSPAAAHLALRVKLPADCWKVVHQNYESQSSLKHQPGICEVHAGSSAHFGWGFTSVVGLPPKESLICLRLVCYVQSSWYQLRFFRKYLLSHLEVLAGVQDPLAFGEWHKKFDGLILAYEEFLTLHNDHKAGQRPLFYEVFTDIEKQWHMSEDMALFKASYNTAREFIGRKFQAATKESERRQEQSLRRQQFALNAIAVIQILTLVGIIADYFDLNKETSWCPLTSVWLPVVLVSATAALLAYLMLAMKDR